MARMHAVFFGFVTHFGGATRSTVELAERLARTIDVTILDVYGTCEPFRAAVERAGLGYRVLFPEPASRVIGGTGLAGRVWRMLGAAPHLMEVRARVRRILREMRPSLVWVNHFKGASIVGFTPSLRDVPLVIYLRGWYTPDQVPWYGRRLCRTRAAAVLALSRATKAALMCSGIDPRKIHVLHNPIEVDAYRELADRPLASPLPQAERPVRILLPADIIRTKGQHTAVEAMRHILDAGHDAVLWLLGEHAWPYGDNRDYLDRTRALANRLGVADRIEWMGRRDDMPQVMKAATVVVFPSHTEGQGRVLLEAMSLAKPVAATPAGGILDMVCENVTGSFFDVDDARGLAECVDHFARAPDFAVRVGRQAQEYMRLSFKPDQQVATALKVFRSVAAGEADAGWP